MTSADIQKPFRAPLQAGIQERRLGCGNRVSDLFTESIDLSTKSENVRDAFAGSTNQLGDAADAFFEVCVA